MHTDAVEDAGKGYDCTFVEGSPEESDCPICLLVLREPSQLECCGRAFCTGCVKKWLRENNACPMCKKKNPTRFIDNRLKRLLSVYQVHCVHRAEGQGIGCEWVGELGGLERHLNKTPSTENQMKGCLYQAIKCRFCGDLFERIRIELHQTLNCPQREYTCPHCGYDSTYISITMNHLQNCPCVPEQCSHCGEIFERRDLDLHVKNECILAPIACNFCLVGCPEQSPREEMAAHMKDNRVGHALLLVNYATEHKDHTLGQYITPMTSCVEALSEISSENFELTSENTTLREEISCLRSLQMALFLAVFLLVMVVIVLSSKLL